MNVFMHEDFWHTRCSHIKTLKTFVEKGDTEKVIRWVQILELGRYAEEKEEFIRLEKLLDFELAEQQKILDNAISQCEIEKFNAKEEIMYAWSKELNLINNIHHFFQNPTNQPRNDLFQMVKTLEEESSFADDYLFEVFNKMVESEAEFVELEESFYQLYRRIQLSSYNYNEDFWDYHLEFKENTWELIYPKVRNYETLKEMVLKAAKLSAFSEFQEFQDFYTAIMQHDDSANSQNLIQASYLGFSCFLEDIYDDAPLRVIRKSYREQEDYIDEEQDIMKSFRNGHQDKVGY